jgi:ABC-type polysaccharide/polyol phosphate export permease
MKSLSQHGELISNLALKDLHLNPLSYPILAYQDVLYHDHLPTPSRFSTILSLTVLPLAVSHVIFMLSKLGFPEEV